MILNHFQNHFKYSLYSSNFDVLCSLTALLIRNTRLTVTLTHSVANAINVFFFFNLNVRFCLNSTQLK